MTHPRLALNSLTTAPWPLSRDLDLAVDLGVAHSGFFHDKLEAAGPEDAVSLIASSGVRATHVFARGTAPDDPRRWAADRARLERAVDLAAALGTPWVTVTTGPSGTLGWDGAVAALARALAPVTEYGRTVGVRLAIEQTLPVRPEVGFVHSFADSVDVAQAIDLGVALEANYCAKERGLTGSVERAVARLAIVQVSDLVPPSTGLPDRAVPGDGVLPLAEVIATVLAAGYRGCFELEQLGPRIESEGYEAACRRGVAALDRLLTEADVVARSSGSDPPQSV